MSSSPDPDPRMFQQSLFGDVETRSQESIVTLESVDADAGARRFAIDPGHHVILEASAGTGKTSVLVARYVNLLKAGVEPRNILAITFTRKAAAEMRERIMCELRDAADRSEIDRTHWAKLRDRLGEISIGTIDAFCLSLLKEFPLEADLDPGFEMADETEVPRLIEEALDHSLRLFISLAKTERDVGLVFAQLGQRRIREGLAALLDRRLVAWDALNRFLANGPSDLTAENVCRRAAIGLREALGDAPGGFDQFLYDGPVEHQRYQLLVRELRRLMQTEDAPEEGVRSVLDRVTAHFLTAEGKARTSGSIPPYRTDNYPSTGAARRHRAAVFQMAPAIERVVGVFRRDLNVVLARGVRRMFGIALAQYRRILDERSVLDFSDVLQRAVDMLRQMDEFAQSRFRLESRYHHVLVDEFQDTSRTQWELISLLIQSWGEGLGVTTQPSIFIVGDRKQSIYRFRDADVAVLQQAARFIEGLRPDQPRRSITRSFRAVPGLLEFVNEVFTEMSQSSGRAYDFMFGDSDRFPIEQRVDLFGSPVLGIAAAEEPAACAAAVAHEIARIFFESDMVRDRVTGVPRQTRPGDIAILFRSRASHREFERELELRGIPSYVYKGLGFFDADETKDLLALIRYLAKPVADVRATAFLRSRFVRLSDRGLAVLAPALAGSLMQREPPPQADQLDDEDRRVLMHARRHVREWLNAVDRLPPADLIEQIVDQTAYAYELRGPRRQQAWENVKKMRALIRRIQNRGYATLSRIADHLDSLTAGDESNAVLEAVDAVNLMTVHASKGLEFPIVFIVNVAKGASGVPKPIRVTSGIDEEPCVSVGPFVSESDEADREREKQETRRLLYVACTRARDRLYLSSALKGGELAPGRGSLAEVLPESMKTLFGRAASTNSRTIAWTGPSGRVFDLRVCRPPAADDMRSPCLVARSPAPRVDVLAAAVPSSTWPEMELRRSAGPLSTTSVTHSAELALSQALLTDDERDGLENAGQIASEALETWRAISVRPDVITSFQNSDSFYEVPFSFADPESPHLILRGIIDCLILKRDGEMLILELKTGVPRETDQQQLNLYVRAARAMFPGRPVSGRLIYS